MTDAQRLTARWKTIVRAPRTHHCANNHQNWCWDAFAPGFFWGMGSGNLKTLWLWAATLAQWLWKLRKAEFMLAQHGAMPIQERKYNGAKFGKIVGRWRKRRALTISGRWLGWCDWLVKYWLERTRLSRSLGLIRQMPRQSEIYQSLMATEGDNRRRLRLRMVLLTLMGKDFV